jgi:hypothetical protein
MLGVHNPTTFIHLCLEFEADRRRPKTYLEIGVREGCSLRRVLKARSVRNAYLCDTWGDSYGGSGRGSHAHIEQILDDEFPGVQATFLDGDSKVTVPALIDEGVHVDMALVDGDHSHEGALADLRNVWQLIRVGGVIIFDDIIHPAHPYLLDTLMQFVKESVVGHGMVEHLVLDKPHGAAVIVKGE